MAQASESRLGHSSKHSATRAQSSRSGVAVVVVRCLGVRRSTAAAAIQQLSRKRGQLGWRLNIFMDEISDSVVPCAAGCSCRSGPQSPTQLLLPNERLLTRPELCCAEVTGLFDLTSIKNMMSVFAIPLAITASARLGPSKQASGRSLFLAPNSAGSPF